jgi:hypothetical protein
VQFLADRNVVPADERLISHFGDTERREIAG